ncbi:hypothetical protein HXX76_013052 [Chlamydomonas incerta]|uniref:rRNA adenine N(6)-methyltransferase n=1 Tax=Chlamydomonas incerta TaxID=51695 RepID=A0A835VSM2_CHLIN|nr:hypothetical protein HXX76_013052 [Chlamydomonas incerta]|eukprot:KAG2426295.1 hypothetical protein HXX76_013052 [Chlamydomonas incerta]
MPELLAGARRRPPRPTPAAVPAGGIAAAAPAAQDRAPAAGLAAPSQRRTAPAAPVQPVIEEGDVELPALGWMWRAGTSSGGGNEGDAADGAASRPMPTAAATVANLYEDRIKAKKSLGQNFMMDDAILRDIVAAAAVGPGDLVLEVGPGTGNLTKHLLSAGARVTAVEKDDTLYARLGQEYEQVPELQLVLGDAVKVGLEGIIRHMPKRVKVVANLPYNITKDLMTLLLPLGSLVSDLHIMIQHEAGERLTERTPGGREWRAANIRTLFYCRPKYRFRISRLKYDPVPGVDGALVTFALRPPAARLPVPSEQGLLELVDKAFSERRKKMRNSLTPLYSSPEVESALAACGLNVDARAQDLTLEQFVALAWQLHRQRVAELGLSGAAGGGRAGRGRDERGPRREPRDERGPRREARGAQEEEEE